MSPDLKEYGPQKAKRVGVEKLKARLYSKQRKRKLVGHEMRL